MSDKGLLKSAILNRFRWLLDMLYSPADLAEHLQVDKREIYDRYMRAGMPTQKDDKGRVWIYGPDATKWADENRRGAHRIKLAKDEGYCRRCKAARPIAGPVERTTMKSDRVCLKAKCPECGGTMLRIMGRAEHDQP
jgi:hypothetical protein